MKQSGESIADCRAKLCKIAEYCFCDILKDMLRDCTVVASVILSCSDDCYLNQNSCIKLHLSHGKLLALI